MVFGLCGDSLESKNKNQVTLPNTFVGFSVEDEGRGINM